MSDFTTRAGLRLPGGGSTGTILPDEQVDIDVLNDNFRKIDALLGARKIPSASSYSGSMDGDLVYAEDTEYLQLFSSNAGTLITPRHPGANFYKGTIAQRDAATLSGLIQDGDHWQVAGEVTPSDNSEYVRVSSDWKPLIKHAEYSFNRSGFGTGLIDLFSTATRPAETNDLTFTSIPGGIGQSIDLNEGGLYSFTFSGLLGVSSTGRGFVSIGLTRSGGTRVLSRAAIPTGEDSAACSVTGVRIQAGDKLMLSAYKTTSITSNFEGVVTATKLQNW